METKKNNQYINFLKGMACLIVIFLHCPFPGVIGEGIIYGVRFSVPVFFMVSGYFSYTKNEEWIKDKAKYILKMILFTELFYGIWEYVKACLIDNLTVAQATNSIFSGKNILQIIFCGSVFNGTLWYLYAIFWTWIILLILRKLNVFEKSYFLIPVLLIILIFGRLYVQNTYDIYKYLFLFRNALTFGVPFTLLGSWLAKNKDKVCSNIDLKKNILLLLFGVVILVAEYVLIGQYMDAQVSTVVVSIALFVWSMCSQKPLNKVLSGLAYIGGKWYTWIYLSHMFFIDVTDIIYREFNLYDNMIMNFARPIIVCICACLCSHFIVKLQRKLKGK